MEFNNILVFLGGLGGTEIFLILFVILLLFGAKKIPELAKGLGRGIREFKDATNEIKHDIEDSSRRDEPQKREQVRTPETPEHRSERTTL